MKVRSNLAQLTKKALYEAITLDMMARIARDIFTVYDIREQTGFPTTVPITSQIAAHHIVNDVIAENRFLQLIERLIQLDREGFMGRGYPVQGLGEIVKQIHAAGYIWDEETDLFMEDPRIRRTPNWGRLVDDDEFQFAILRLDVAGNSRMVKAHGEEAMRGALEDLRQIVSRCVEVRTGRVWQWEGDGALAGFLFGSRTSEAVLAGMAILHELFLYDRLHNRLGEPLRIRAAVHTGPLKYQSDPEKIIKQEIIQETIEVEANQTPTGALVITPAVAPTLDRVILDRFHPVSHSSDARLLAYEVRVEGT